MNTGLFASVASEYASFRPGYPAGLFAWLSAACAARESAWDCACGSGQASVPLADHFATVFATDAAPEQIAAARPHARVRYSVANAERSGLPDASMDLITVAQALHWFDVTAFYDEARRVARPGALLAVWTYPRPRLEDVALDRRFEEFYSRTLGAYWPPERRHVDSGYETLPFPFAEMAHPPFELDLRWGLAQLLGYVSSWSATVRYRQALRRDPVPELHSMLCSSWPGGHGTVRVRLPLKLRVARVH
jgi:SAM-dependent methyltransferase